MVLRSRISGRLASLCPDCSPRGPNERTARIVALWPENLFSGSKDDNEVEVVAVKKPDMKKSAVPDS